MIQHDILGEAEYEYDLEGLDAAELVPLEVNRAYISEQDFDNETTVKGLTIDKNNLEYELSKAHMKPGRVYSYRGKDHRVTFEFHAVFVKKTFWEPPKASAILQGFMSDGSYSSKFAVSADFINILKSQRGLRVASKEERRKSRKLLAKYLLKQ